jgi:hypothetical protein
MNKFNIKLYKIDIFVFSSNVAGLDTKDTILYSVAFEWGSYCSIISVLCSNLSNANDYVKFEK